MKILVPELFKSQALSYFLLIDPKFIADLKIAYGITLSLE